jgi:hypothetical protein
MTVSSQLASQWKCISKEDRYLIMSRTSRLKGNIPKPVINRQHRRREREDQHNVAEFLSKRKSSREAIDRRVDEIAQMMRKSGVEFVDNPAPIKFVSDSAHDSVVAQLRRLAYNPDGNLTDTTLPWHGDSLTATQARRLLKRLPVPEYARDLKEGVLASLSTPSTSGMIRPDGSPNKDLQQLLVNAGNPELSVELKGCWDRAFETLVSDFLTWNGGVLRFNDWTLDDFRNGMRKAIKESSPGYPFNGLSWEDDLGDGTVLSEVFNSGKSSRTEAEKEGYLFIQGARYTGDGGYTPDRTKMSGQQRLVCQAPAVEKLDGHIIAEPLKAFFKLPRGSGQRGIQAVKTYLKDLAQGRTKSDLRNGKIVAWASADVSKWDTSQTNELAEMGFFAFLKRVCDPEHELTMNILANYQERYMASYLWTACGFIKPNMLKSGASITTVMAFVHHTLMLYCFDELVKQRTGSYAIVDFGIQGDDQWACYSQWNETVDSALREVYSAFHCVIKGDLRIRFQRDDDVSVVFLNEVISLKDDKPNIVFPKWNFFFAETIDDRRRGVNVDRMLMDEVRTRIAHPSSMELLVVSYLSKMDRMKDMPFYEFLFKHCVKKTTICLSSWMGARTMPDSFTRKYHEEYEVQAGIEYPGDIVASCDRREDTWLLSEDLGQLVGALFVAAENCASSKIEIRKIIKYARGGKPWRRAGRALDAVSDIESPGYLELSALVSAAFIKGYRDRAEAEEQRLLQAYTSTEAKNAVEELNALSLPDVDNTGEPIMHRTLARAVLAFNDRDPYELVWRSYKALAELYQSPSWDGLHPDQKELVKSVFLRVYNTHIDGGHFDTRSEFKEISSLAIEAASTNA